MFNQIRLIDKMDVISSAKKIVIASAITATHMDIWSAISSLYHLMYFFPMKYIISPGTPHIKVIMITIIM